MMKVVRRNVPGTRSAVLVPAAWRVSAEPEVGLLAVEDVPGRFAASFSAVLEAGRTDGLVNPVASATAPLVAPAVVDVRADERGVEILVCHLAGGISATALQRQVLVAEGLLVLTVTAATSRWAELGGLADELVDSLEAAA